MEVNFHDPYFAAASKLWPRDAEHSVPLPQNQLDTRSCIAFSAVYCLYSEMHRAGQTPARLLSVQELLDIFEPPMTIEIVMTHVKGRGLFLDTDYPYTGQRSQFDILNPNITYIRYAASGYDVISRGEIVEELDRRSAVGTAIVCTPGFLKWNREGIFTFTYLEAAMMSELDVTCKSHALTLVGYGKEGGNDFFVAMDTDLDLFPPNCTHKGYIKIDPKCFTFGWYPIGVYGYQFGPEQRRSFYGYLR